MSFHLKIVYDRTPVAGTEDVAVTTHDFGSDQNHNLTLAEATAIMTAFNTFWLAIDDRIANNVRLREGRFYDGYNGDGSPGEVDFIIPSTLPGLSVAAMLPPQCACAITERTGQRRSWGRWYLPGLSTEVLSDDGRILGGIVTQFANAARDLYNAWATSVYQPIVWTKIPNVAPRVQLEVDEIQVDDVVDIIRRRRWDTVINRTRHAVTDPTP